MKNRQYRMPAAPYTQDVLQCSAVFFNFTYQENPICAFPWGNTKFTAGGFCFLA